MLCLIKVTTMILFLSGSNQLTRPDFDAVKETPITVQNLSQKWMLEKYKISFYSEKSSEKEENDYIHLKSDMTFASVSEGEYEEGEWEFDAKNNCIILRKENENDVLPFIIEELKSNKLVLYTL